MKFMVSTKKLSGIALTIWMIGGRKAHGRDCYSENYQICDVSKFQKRSSFQCDRHCAIGIRTIHVRYKIPKKSP